MQDPPSAPELVSAVAAFLREDAMAQLCGRSAYLARVAANALDIVAREISLAPGAGRAELDRLGALLGERPDAATDLRVDLAASLDAGNAELCARIERGELGPDTPGLLAHLWQTTLDKLMIDQPTYSGYLRALDETPPEDCAPSQ